MCFKNVLVLTLSRVLISKPNPINHMFFVVVVVFIVSKIPVPTMQYLFHHPHLPIIYPSKDIKQEGGNIFITHWSKVMAMAQSSSVMWIMLMIYAIIVQYLLWYTWWMVSQLPGDVKSNQKQLFIRQVAKFKPCMLELWKWRFSINLVHQLAYLYWCTYSDFEDNQGTIKCVKAARISDNAQQLDVKIMQLEEQYDEGIFGLEYMKTQFMLAECETKPTSGELLWNHHSRMIGFHYYPHPSTQHYKDLALESCACIKVLKKWFALQLSFIWELRLNLSSASGGWTTSQSHDC